MMAAVTIADLLGGIDIYSYSNCKLQGKELE